MRKQLIPFVTAGLLAALALAPSTALLASPSFVFASGFNQLDINDLEAAIYSLDIGVSKFGDSVVRRGTTFSFPISDGTVDAETLLFQVLSRGGLEFKIATDVLILNAPIVTVIGGQPQMTFLVTVDGTLQGRYAMFDLQPPAYPVPASLAAGEGVHFANIIVTLSTVGAHMLNTTFATSLVAGQSVGTLTVKAVIGTRLPG